MQSSNRLLDDLARVASGAASAVAGMRAEIEGLVRQRVERLINELDLVGRDEFDVAKAMATRARAEQERLEQRVSALEAALAEALAAQSDEQPAQEGERASGHDTAEPEADRGSAAI
jgi:BMFP domain-containing protein YqiC